MTLDRISSFVVALAVATAMAYSLAGNLDERKDLQTTIDRQAGPLGEVERVEKQLDDLKSGTMLLATNGNRVAQQVVQILRANGVDVQRPPAATGPGVPAGTSDAAPAPEGGEEGAPGRTKADLDRLLEAPKN